MQTRSKNGIYKPKLGYAAQVDYTLTEPSSYKAAAQHPQWCTAMQDEFDALQKQGTWSLVAPPPNKNVVGCKWVYKLKHNSDGTIARYKARLVAKGFHQQQGVDFDETFSPVIKPPTGYIDSTHPHHVCRLHKSIYGLKQAPRAWFKSFTTQQLHLGFIASSADSSLFIYHHQQVIAYLLLYVDDIVLTSNSPSFLDHLILQLRKVFDLKDLGALHYFLGLQVSRTSDALHVTQSKYASDLLIKHHMVDSKPAKTPCSPNTRLSMHEGDLLSDPHGYRSLVRVLHYLTFTRPDISFVVHQVCQYMAAPTSTHLTAAKRVLRYIKGTLYLGIAFTPGPLSLSVFSDADWAGDLDDRRSTSGLLVYLGSIQLLGLPRNNLPYLASPLSLNIELLPLLPLRCVGFAPYSKILKFICHNLQFCGRSGLVLTASGSRWWSRPGSRGGGEYGVRLAVEELRRGSRGGSVLSCVDGLGLGVVGLPILRCL
uniref:Reverse transcriptase Ty1/copia-type domain-containing protein n=1 Tax=Fagus sylvatica TaxID=28930 RepID=A0A2N9GEN7_FAGSY